ncbi:MAG: hypothetical protein F6K11_01095 [Leptolyngbya sp. SIO3F4]|nr:hypothetical protein [Leptolyngbya sp. SIO3F4]
MADLTNIKDLTTDLPDTWTFLWSPEEAKAIPNEHKDQIHFLNDQGTKVVNDFLRGSKMINGIPSNPINPDYFKSVDSFWGFEPQIKKWLYNKGIPFDKYVFVDQDKSGQAVMLTWKMVIKYCRGLFFSEDVVVFDQSLNWVLYYWHSDRLFFAEDPIFDRDKEYQKTLEVNEILNRGTSVNKR